ncbi:MAG: phospho-N-acetylmuramoyl-pentapeptide-transferase [Moraxella sp.]|nr:phospho-N-acetylmuramoyl-pentapeptide-transferase [Moraxella sp.]
MLYWLIDVLGILKSDTIASLALRSLLAVMSSFVIVLMAGKPVIAYLRGLKYGQAVRDDGPKTHLVKQGTPTMGGVLILFAIGVSVLFWANLANPYVWILMAVMVIFGAVGWRDDWLKIKHKNPQGLIARKKYFWLSVGALLAGGSLYYIALQQDVQTMRAMQDLLFPIFKNWVIPLSAIPFGLGFITLTYFAINGTSNAVNLTDGLDGLVALPVVLVSAGLGVFAYVSGHVEWANYLSIPYIAYNGEVVVVCASMIGACLGFLWYNAAPAEVFMGDVGALSLGGMLGTMAVMVRQEMVFILMGGIFVAEAMSVILQVGSYKLRKKRIFLMAPLHHHFEEKGLKETKVVIRFWIVCIILVVLSLMTLKLR